MEFSIDECSPATSVVVGTGLACPHSPSQDVGSVSVAVEDSMNSPPSISTWSTPSAPTTESGDGMVVQLRALPMHQPPALPDSEEVGQDSTVLSQRAPYVAAGAAQLPAASTSQPSVGTSTGTPTL